MAGSKYPLRVQDQLIDAGLAQIVVVDGEPTLMVDPIFELARQAAMVGIDDAEAVRREGDDPDGDGPVIDLTDDAVPGGAG